MDSVTVTQQNKQSRYSLKQIVEGKTNLVSIVKQFLMSKVRTGHLNHNEGVLSGCLTFEESLSLLKDDLVLFGDNCSLNSSFMATIYPNRKHQPCNGNIFSQVSKFDFVTFFILIIVSMIHQHIYKSCIIEMNGHLEC